MLNNAIIVPIKKFLSLIAATHSMSGFVFLTQTLNECTINQNQNKLKGVIKMKSSELKEIRKKIGARQKDLAELLGVPTRTYQNWEQAEESKAHRDLPKDYAERIQSLYELQSSQKNETSLPEDLVWLQVPLRKRELKELKRAAMLKDKNLPVLVREAIFIAMQR